MAQIEFELAYYDVALQQINHDATETTPASKDKAYIKITDSFFRDSAFCKRNDLDNSC